MSSSLSSENSAELNWWVFQRVQDVRAALRINVIRTVAVVTFYAIHLANYFSLNEASQAERDFHWYVSLIFVGWLAMCLIVVVACEIRYLPTAAKYVTTLVDILLLTAAAGIGAKSGSWLVLVYFLIIGSTSLRFDLKLTAVATGLSILGYLALVGMADEKWFDKNHATPISQVCMVVTGLLLAGAISLQSYLGCRSWFEIVESRDK